MNSKEGAKNKNLMSPLRKSILPINQRLNQSSAGKPKSNPPNAPARRTTQQTPLVLQRKRVTPAVYKPQPQPHVLQKKTVLPPAPWQLQNQQPKVSPPAIARPKNPALKPGVTQSIQRQAANTRVSSYRPLLRVVQRSTRREEEIRADMRARAEKKEKMRRFAQAHHHLYRPEPNWPEQQQVTGLSFGDNRSSASIITSESGDTVYVSEQSGKATRNPDIVWNLSGAETIATD